MGAKHTQAAERRKDDEAQQEGQSHQHARTWQKPNQGTPAANAAKEPVRLEPKWLWVYIYIYIYICIDIYIYIPREIDTYI